MRNKEIKYKMFFIMFSCAVFLVLSKGLVFAQGPRDLIDQKCITCHNLKRVNDNQMTAKRWDDTIRRMQSKRMPSLLTEQQLNQIVSYVVENNLKQRKEIFRRRCFDCHEGNNNKKPLFLKKTKLGWKRAIERMRQKYYIFIGIDEAEEIAVYWTDTANNENIRLEANDFDRLEGIFENKCGACHSYKFLHEQKYNLQGWHLILDRMYQKNPIILKESDLKDIKDYLLQSKSFLVK